MANKNIYVNSPEEISDYLESFKCHKQDYQVVEGAKKTIKEGEGNSPSIAVVGAYMLDSIGYQPKVMNFVTSHGLGVKVVKFMSTPVYENGDIYASGVPTPEGTIGKDTKASSLEELAAGIHKKLEKQGYSPKRVTIDNLNNYDEVVDWRNDEGSPLLPRLPTAEPVDYTKYL